MSKKNGDFNYKDGITLKDYFESKFEALNKAIDLQHKEYARRLDSLNGEGERLRCMQASYLPREVYEANHKELCGKVEKIEAYINQLIGKLMVISVLIPIAISLVFLIIDFIIR